ncbi:MAG: ATP-binding cassette domain-containing protein [Bacteroidales bacterium]|nr:ATP-binding cassette domain-containing protein [Bacteroidales bacterium]
MSEEILKALMQLFALIVKQDGGMLGSEREYVISFLEKQISHESVKEYITMFDSWSGPVTDADKFKADVSPSVKDSVRILGICKTINRTLTQSQKVVVLMRLFELVNSEDRYTTQRMNIIHTVANVFRIHRNEFTSIESFVSKKGSEDCQDDNILIIKNMNICQECHDEVAPESVSSLIFVLRVSSVDLYFIKHFSHHQLSLNGLPLLKGKVYTMATGSSLRYQYGKPIYYSDITAHYLSGQDFRKISLRAENVVYRFREGTIAINSISLSESEGTLTAILGSSGTGKTTLMSILNGIQKPNSGKVTINGIDVHGTESLEGVIGYVPQDDMLIEDLTVFENLYYAASLCFREKSAKEISILADTALRSLGLSDKRDLKVGSPLNKVISGGQRKRLNIALELIREPSVLFIDEPTSGLSSRDSDNVIDLLRELTFKGKLIITVIHQPSSELFKMFDRVIILDHGGEMVYYGNPIESLIYFKTLDSQIDSNIGECPACGNINPEIIFNILESEVVDEFGKYTGIRKTSPSEWARHFSRLKPEPELLSPMDPPPSNLNRPGRFRQLIIYASRDLRSKISNRQYVFLTLLEAPVLGFILSYLIRYIADPTSDNYVFKENENIPIYIFMSLIVALFLGLITSAEEIFRDRKILRRERFLNLSRNSYLLAKIGILFFISAIQALLFVAVANPILGIKGLTLHYWFALFTTSAVANLLGLNISNSFNSAITIYIVVPMLMIPMMVLSGAMFPFDKLNRTIGSVGQVPVIAELIPTKWTYEALMVTQARDNKYDRLVYELKREMSVAEYNTIHRLPALSRALDKSRDKP